MTCHAAGTTPVIVQLIMQPLKMYKYACSPQKLRHFQGHYNCPALLAGSNCCIHEKVRIPPGQPLLCGWKEWECPLTAAFCASCKSCHIRALDNSCFSFLIGPLALSPSHQQTQLYCWGCRLLWLIALITSSFFKFPFILTQNFSLEPEL